MQITQEHLYMKIQIFWILDCKIVIGWNLFKYFIFNKTKRLKNKLEWILAFPSKFFDLNSFFGSIDCKSCDQLEFN